MCKAAWEGYGPWRAELGDDVTRQGVFPNGRLFVPKGLVFGHGLGWPDVVPTLIIEGEKANLSWRWHRAFDVTLRRHDAEASVRRKLPYSFLRECS